MIDITEQQFFEDIVRVFDQSNYSLSVPLIGCGGCFDLIAKRRAILILVKLLENIDSLREEQAYELRKLASMLAGYPLIIGQRIRSSVAI
ncbi:MAG: hypothetical protein U9O98_05385 [Asgard group archaeon]|nr:hypothetical protein [Asgard group archaeon]